MHLKLSQAYLSSATQLFYDPEKMYDVWENDTVNGQWKHKEVSLYVTRPFKVNLMFQQTYFYQPPVLMVSGYLS